MPGDKNLDTIFGALADPTRRAILSRVRRQPARIGDLAQPFAMTLAAVSKHVKVLEAAGLIRREVHGRTHVCHAVPGAALPALAWLESASGHAPGPEAPRPSSREARAAPGQRGQARTAAQAGTPAARPADPRPVRPREAGAQKGSPMSIQERITAARMLPHSPATVFAALIDARSAPSWVFEAYETPASGDTERFVEIDPRPGGHFRLIRSGPEGSHYRRGTFLELSRGEYLIFTYADGPETAESEQVQVELYPESGGCVIVVSHALEPGQPERGARLQNGWARLLEALAWHLGPASTEATGAEDEA
ncbi:metalloregulator ArsR/SmtB family transcription factor [Paroceanicella profunda]|uniref:Metalloregulator ArsR/SmtB family transcription factor n=1 Tax=Paroceanicella profunda TaxID=2579971 RepID=A0A5B8G1E2_9RHOB|nr:metalloregulator ArsR/SmtB family transcription factor [Paroceanicella profunda]QDL92293.1 metalloregulator ArsR/SmtB family transcription factor [Paroceanicella profunda]